MSISDPEPFLLTSAVQKRMQWARDNMGMDWTWLIWTDETMMVLGEKPMHRKVTRRPGEEFLLECIDPQVISGHASLMVWGAIGYNTKGPLIWVDLEPSQSNGKMRTKAEGLNRPKYTEQILRGPFLDFYTQVKNTTGKDILVMENGALAHHAKYTKTAQDELRMPSH